MDNPSPPAAFSELPFYSAHFMDPRLWEPFVHRVAADHGFDCRRIVPGMPGTFPTFIVELDNSSGQQSQAAIVVKFFGPLFDGAASYVVEQAMGYFTQQYDLGIRSPTILADGRLSSDWSYLIFEHIPGVSIGQVRQELSTSALEGVARQMGHFMRQLHSLTATADPIIPLTTQSMCWEGYLAFLEAQWAGCFLNHQDWHDLPAHLLNQVQDFLLPVDRLLDVTSPPHLIHADLTSDHLLGRCTPYNPTSVAASLQEGVVTAEDQPGNRWDSLAIIDWGDCRIGNILYELMALHLDLFRADKNLLRVCLESYRLPAHYQLDFSHKALSMVLLHQFPLPAQIISMYSDVQTLNELAVRLFGIF